jgi:hypothetical protein
MMHTLPDSLPSKELAALGRARNSVRRSAAHAKQLHGSHLPVRPQNMKISIAVIAEA